MVPAKPAAPSVRATPPEVEWFPCSTGVECGELIAPLDYANAAGETVSLSVARRAARNAATRIGVLFVNPGGPAGSAVDMVSAESFAKDVPASILDRFDVIGLDPRGVNRTVPVLCAITPPTTGDRTERNRLFATSCGQRSGKILPFVGTDSSAEDLETLRRSAKRRSPTSDSPMARTSADCTHRHIRIG
jgi:pimeloyl-ACP methyl ester carboxylesterase